jgi:hypothetical protein
MSSTRETEDKKLEKLMIKLEKEGMEDIKELQKKEGLIPTEQSLTNLLQKGADEFEKEIGRKMSYGEMREMYG